jgi:hypothetical protein
MEYLMAHSHGNYLPYFLDKTIKANIHFSKFYYPRHADIHIANNPLYLKLPEHELYASRKYKTQGQDIVSSIRHDLDPSATL